MQSGSWVIPKTTFANLCKPVHNVMIIPFLSAPFNLEKLIKEKQKMLLILTIAVRQIKHTWIFNLK